MLKKSLIILFIIFSILCISNIAFAANTTNNVQSAVTSTTNTVVDGVSNLAKDVRNGVGHVENGIEDALTMGNTTNANTRTDVNARTTNDGYTATRTTGVAGATTGTNNTTMWVWVIVAVAAVVIIGLVWYYGSQNRVD